MAGYNGYSMSNNAVSAYDDYKMPISKLRKFLGIKDTSYPACEWHHASKFYNSVDFFDAREAIICGDIKNLSIAKPDPLQLYNRYLVKCIIIEEASLKCTAKVAVRFEKLSNAADIYLAAKKAKKAEKLAIKQKKEAEEYEKMKEMMKKNKDFRLTKLCEYHKISSQKITEAFASKNSDDINGIYTQIRKWFAGLTIETALKYAV